MEARHRRLLRACRSGLRPRNEAAAETDGSGHCWCARGPAEGYRWGKMTVVVRPGVRADAEGLADLAARTFRDTFAADNDARDLALYLARAYGPVEQGRELADPQITTLLAEVDGQTVGYAQLRRGPAPACVTGEAPIELWRLYVERKQHGRGVAQELMRCVDREARQAGARTLWLGVWERNERAKAFYRKWSFVDVGSQVFMVGSDAQTDHILVRALPLVASADPA
jgi:diamine N-acetyltransferase